jgi:arabinose-5-phosphate isomerase
MKYIDFGIQSVKAEIKGLQSVLDNSINETFEKVVSTILKVKGRIIISGVGKPGYIAHKTSATFSSTGTPAYYIHANEASHGDLGMIDKNDIVILLSNSGESKELNDIIAYCKRFNITLIGLTRKKKSFLAKTSTIPVILEDIEEANTVNSPTTSIVMMLSYLDAVAAALINAKNFGKNEFKIFHPGGKIGAELLTVSEIMKKENELPIVHEDDFVSLTIDIMINKPLGCVVVLDKNEKLVGILTDGDFKRKIIQYSNLLQKRIGEIMTKNPITIQKDDFIIDALNIMQKGAGNSNNYIQVLLVVENEKIVGLLHIQDCLKAGVI